MKEYKYEICERVLGSKKTLRNHFFTLHNNSGKLFYCDVCTKSFQSQSTLGFHVKSVHGSKNNNCESYGKSFSRAWNLKHHIHSVHDGHKDYKCEPCWKSFSQVVNLKRHITQFTKATKITNVNLVGKHLL